MDLEKNGDNPKEWESSEYDKMKKMLREGKGKKRIAKELGRTVEDVMEKLKEENGISRPKEAEPDEEDSSTVTRDKARDMTRAARQIARSNGKRITMAMFFIEDL